MRRKRDLCAALGFLVAAVVGLPGVSAARADEPDRVPVAHLTDTWADQVVREGTDAGPTDPSTQLTAQVFLTGDASGLATYARAVSDPADRRYGLRIGETEYDIDGNLGYTEDNGGGTSLSSPLFAGIEALLVQEHGPLGFANPVLYTRGRAFHHIHDNPAGTPDTVAYAVSRRGFVTLVTPGQYADANLEFAPATTPRPASAHQPGH